MYWHACIASQCVFERVSCKPTGVVWDSWAVREPDPTSLPRFLDTALQFVRGDAAPGLDDLSKEHALGTQPLEQSSLLWCLRVMQEQASPALPYMGAQSEKGASVPVVSASHSQGCVV